MTRPWRQFRPSSPFRASRFFSAVTREYFYHVDDHGQVFLAETEPKNIATSLKDKKVVDFFTRHVRPNETGVHTRDYPWVSMCMGEHNFVSAAATPIVFQELRTVAQHRAARRSRRSRDADADADGDEKNALLVYGSRLVLPFQPDALRWDESSGRLFHPVPDVHGIPNDLAMVRGSLVMQWMEDGLFLEDGAHASDEPVFVWHGVELPVRAVGDAVDEGSK